MTIETIEDARRVLHTARRLFASALRDSGVKDGRGAKLPANGRDAAAAEVLEKQLAPKVDERMARELLESEG